MDEAHVNLGVAGDCIAALRAGEATEYARAGALLEAEFMLSVIALVRAFAKR